MKHVWIDAHRDEFSVARMCRQLRVSRSGYCQWRTRLPSPRAQANAALDVQVAAIHATTSVVTATHGFYVSWSNP